MYLKWPTVLEGGFTEAEATEVSSSPGPRSSPGGAGMGTQAPLALAMPRRLSIQQPLLGSPLS